MSKKIPKPITTDEARLVALARRKELRTMSLDDKYSAKPGQPTVKLRCADHEGNFTFPKHENGRGRYPTRCKSCHFKAYGNRVNLLPSYVANREAAAKLARKTARALKQAGAAKVSKPKAKAKKSRTVKESLQPSVE